MISQFKNMWAGKPVYVFGSGKSLDYLDHSLFDGKPCATTNHVGQRWGLSGYFVCSHHYEAGERYRQMGEVNPIICPDRDTTKLHMKPIPDGDGVFRFTASQQRFGGFAVEYHWPEDPDTLVTGSTGLHTAMHFAQYAGASHIVLVGADCGRLDDEVNFTGYWEKGSVFTGPTEDSWDAWEQHNRQVANKLRSLGCPVYSLNPFINFGLEGHHFKGGA